MSVLFVCMGNICRSPIAAGAFSKLLLEQVPGLHLEVDSAGTHGYYHSGSAPDPRAQRAAMRRGIDLSAMRARSVVEQDFYRFDLILAMDELNRETLLAACPPGCEQRVRLFMDYAQDAPTRNVPDPYYGDATGFERVLDLVEVASRGLLSELRKGL